MADTDDLDLGLAPDQGVPGTGETDTDDLTDAGGVPDAGDDSSDAWRARYEEAQRTAERQKSTIGKQGNELGELRRQLAQLTAMVQGGQPPVAPAPAPVDEYQQAVDAAVQQRKAFYLEQSYDDDTANRLAQNDINLMSSLATAQAQRAVSALNPVLNHIAPTMVERDMADVLQRNAIEGVTPQELLADMQGADFTQWHTIPRQQLESGIVMAAKAKLADKMLAGTWTPTPKVPVAEAPVVGTARPTGKPPVDAEVQNLAQMIQASMETPIPDDVALERAKKMLAARKGGR